MKANLSIRFVLLIALILFNGVAQRVLGQKSDGKILDLGTGREIFVDNYLIEKLEGTRLMLKQPVDKGVMFVYDKPWETYAPAYVTILKDGDLYRAYYRAGKREGLRAYTNDEWTCYAESKNGVDWVKPDLGLFEFHGSKANNIVLANEAPIHHNFSPFIDKNPQCHPDQKYKALGGTSRDGIGLIPYCSADAIHWKKMNNDGVIKKGAFDSQNVSFWSESEGKYICYFRTFTKLGRVRTVSRTTSSDFINWTPPVEMTYGDTPFEHLYIQQTSPYFRAPHIYVAIGARLLPDRKIATTEQLNDLKVDPTQHKGLSEPYLMTTRGDSLYDRTFMEAFIRPATGLNNWSARCNFPALNVVQTGLEEMSLYVNQDYTQPTSHLHRYAMRLDGFSSINAPYKGGEVLTKPFFFSGKELEINYSTAAAGDIQIEIQDIDGKPINGFSISDCQLLIGNELARTVSWTGGSDLSKLVSRPIRLRIHMKDADLFSMRFK
jgi:hypothetical protein